MAGAILLTRLLTTLLFEVEPTDALTFLAVSTVLHDGRRRRLPDARKAGGVGGSDCGARRSSSARVLGFIWF